MTDKKTTELLGDTGGSIRTTVIYDDDIDAISEDGSNIIDDNGQGLLLVERWQDDRRGLWHRFCSDLNLAVSNGSEDTRRSWDQSPQ